MPLSVVQKICIMRLVCNLDASLLMSEVHGMETVNIHSHLIGAVLFAWLLGTFRQVYFVHYEHTTWIDSTVFTVFLGSAILCLFGSAFYHTSCVHSEAVSDFAQLFDLL